MNAYPSDLELNQLSKFADFNNNIYLSPSRRDGKPGTGTVFDPFDCSTESKFDALMRRFFLQDKKNLTFHLLSGTFLTKGSYGIVGADNWSCLSGWRFLGSGRDNTIVKVSSYRYLNPEDKDGSNIIVFRQLPWGKVGIEVRDLTIDGSWADFTTPITSSFVVPASQQNVTIQVQDSSKFTNNIGKHLFIQRTDNYISVGVYELVSVDSSTSLTIKNLSDQFNTNLTGNINTPVLIGPRINICGVGIGSIRSVVVNVRVTNVGCPIYEGAMGIVVLAINGESPVKPARGIVIRDCIVDNTWGNHGHCIQIRSNNPDTGDNGTSIQGVIENNIVVGNGFHQGLGGWGFSNTIWRNNTIINCRWGFFIDVGYNRDNLVENNFFDSCGESVQIGGGYTLGWERFTFRNNKISLQTSGRAFLFNGRVTESSIIGNEIYVKPSGISCKGLYIYNDGFTSKNRIVNNFIHSGCLNTVPSGTAYSINNINETGVLLV